jgi:hypothetical protein
MIIKDKVEMKAKKRKRMKLTKRTINSDAYENQVFDLDRNLNYYYVLK